MKEDSARPQTGSIVASEEETESLEEERKGWKAWQRVNEVGDTCMRETSQRKLNQQFSSSLCPTLTAVGRLHVTSSSTTLQPTAYSYTEGSLYLVNRKF